MPVTEPDRPADPRSVSRITDPRALRALAHPTRLSLLGLLRTHGPLTATRAGELLGESSASCSFHLRQLAKYGLVREASGGHGRERPWRATAMLTSIPDVSGDPEFAAAADALRGMFAERYFDAALRWLQASADEPEEWRQAAQFGDRLLYLTAAELADLSARMRELLDGYLDRTGSPELRPPDARLVSAILLAFPVAGQGAAEQHPQAPGRDREVVAHDCVAAHDTAPPHRGAGSRPPA